MSSVITGLDVIYGRDTHVQPGYHKIPIDLNKGASLFDYVYLCYTTEPSAGGPITGILVCASKRANLVIQSGYTRIEKDLNKGAVGKHIYICYTRDKRLPPIAEVGVIQASTSEVYPSSIEWIRDNQDCCQGNKGEFTFITYRRADVARECEQRASERERRAKEVIRAAEEKLSKAEQRAREAEQKVAEIERKAKEELEAVKMQLGEVEHKVKEADLKVREAELKIREAEMRAKEAEAK